MRSRSVLDHETEGTGNQRSRKQKTNGSRDRRTREPNQHYIILIDPVFEIDLILNSFQSYQFLILMSSAISIFRFFSISTIILVATAPYSASNIQALKDTQQRHATEPNAQAEAHSGDTNTQASKRAQQRHPTSKFPCAHDHMSCQSPNKYIARSSIKRKSKSSKFQEILLQTL